MIVAATDLSWIGVFFPSHLLLERVGAEMGEMKAWQPGGKGTFASLVAMEGCWFCSDVGLDL